MDYKKIIKSRDRRRKILRLLAFVPDITMLKMQYRMKMGRKLNIKNPERFTEKLQWYKLYYKNPNMIKCVDKYDVREYVKSKGLEDILVPCYGAYDSVEDIDWDSLPDKFVMKDTLGGGGTSVIIVKDKNKQDINELKRRATEWTALQAHTRSDGREWPYYCGKNHRILIEELIEADENTRGLDDYKFFCFDGKCEFIYVMGDRAVGQSVKVSLFNRDFNKLPVMRVGDEVYEFAKKPENYVQMLAVAEKLAAEFPHVRVDLYSVNGKIFFGELTFYNASGYMQYEPDTFDYEIGKQFVLPT